MTLQEYLEKRDLTEAEFAQIIGKNQTTVGRYKRGTLMPRPSTIVKIEEVTKGAVKFKDWVQ